MMGFETMNFTAARIVGELRREALYHPKMNSISFDVRTSVEAQILISIVIFSR